MLKALFTLMIVISTMSVNAQGWIYETGLDPFTDEDISRAYLVSDEECYILFTCGALIVRTDGEIAILFNTQITERWEFNIQIRFDSDKAQWMRVAASDEQDAVFITKGNRDRFVRQLKTKETLKVRIYHGTEEHILTFTLRGSNLAFQIITGGN